MTGLDLVIDIVAGCSVLFTLWIILRIVLTIGFALFAKPDEKPIEPPSDRWNKDTKRWESPYGK